LSGLAQWSIPPVDAYPLCINAAQDLSFLLEMRMIPRVKILPEPAPKPAGRTSVSPTANKAVKTARREALVERDAAIELGRPVEYVPAYDGLVHDLRMLGLSVPQISGVLKISDATLYDWQAKYPSFSEAWLRGGEYADAAIARALFHRASGYSHKATKIQFDKDGEELRADFIQHYPPDTAAGIFWLTNRQKGQWKVRNATELSNPDGSALQPPTVIINAVMPDPAES
jgi:hypothetical protein